MSSSASPLRSILPLAIGLLVGGVGVHLFRGSLPGAEGSPEQKVAKLEAELKGVRNELNAYKATSGRPRSGKTLTDGLRNLAEDIHAGRPVSPDDIFHNFQPVLRDLAPLFERIRVRDAEKAADSMAGEYARRYNLTPAQQEGLKEWFKQKAEDDAKAWSDMVSRSSTTLKDLQKESRNLQADKGVDAYMEKALTGKPLADFKTERMNQRAERVQQQADMRVERINSIVPLDEGQRDSIFGIMARSSEDFDPSMQIEVGENRFLDSHGATGEEATMAVLRPEQREAYEAEKERRRQSAAKDLEAIGLTLPRDWDSLDP